MSDLISRRELIKHFEAIQQEENVVGLVFVAAIDEIKGQPTAYDVDKVVEELKKELSLAKKEKEKCTGENHLQFYSTKGYAGGISYAIEVVKQGVVSDDVCEWKQDNMCETVYRVCGGFSTTAYQTDFEFCPYCGKKIKVVE